MHTHICICVCMCVLVAQSCPTFCDPKDCSPPGCSVHGILQARTLEWFAISFSIYIWTNEIANTFYHFPLWCYSFSCGFLFLYEAIHICTCMHVHTAAAAAKSLPSCPTLCDPVDGSPPGSLVPGIHQARTLEWVAIFFSNAWKCRVKVKSLSCVQLLATPWTAAHQAPPPMGFSRQQYWSGYLHIWDDWCFSRQPWFQLVLHPTWLFAWCTLPVS